MYANILTWEDNSIQRGLWCLGIPGISLYISHYGWGYGEVRTQWGHKQIIHKNRVVYNLINQWGYRGIGWKWNPIIIDNIKYCPVDLFRLNPSGYIIIMSCLGVETPGNNAEC